MPTIIPIVPILGGIDTLEASGAIFALYWHDNDKQAAAFVEYGPEELRSSATTKNLVLVESLAAPHTTPELVMCCSIFQSLAAQDTKTASVYAAALARYTGWRFIAIHETYEGECFIQCAPAKDRDDFEAQMIASLKVAPGPPGWTKPPPAPADLIQGLHRYHK